MSSDEASDVAGIPDGLKAYRRAAQWLSLQARGDEAGLNRLDESIGDALSDWANLVTAVADIAQKEGVARRGGDLEAWAAHVSSLASHAYSIQWSEAALGAVTEQVRASESRAEPRRHGAG